MFGDRLKMGDGATVHLQCAHDYSGGEQRCKNCGIFANHVIQNQIVEHTEIDWTDGLEYLRSHDV